MLTVFNNPTLKKSFDNSRVAPLDKLKLVVLATSRPMSPPSCLTLTSSPRLYVVVPTSAKPTSDSWIIRDSSTEDVLVIFKVRAATPPTLTKAPSS